MYRKKKHLKNQEGEITLKKKNSRQKKTNRGGNSLKIETDHMRYFF